MTSIPALAEGNVAVVTGAAGGIGLAACKTFARAGLKVVLADLAGDALNAARDSVAQEGAKALAVATDVAQAGDLVRLQERAAVLGPVTVLMNNAGVMFNPGSAYADLDGWKRLLDINFFGVLHGVQAFAAAMIAHGRDALIINTGSKQGITLPPGNSAYNVSKAALKAYTESLAHELRSTPGCKVSAHLLIPGFTHTGMTARSPEKPPGAWSAQQVVDFMLESIGRGDFYVLCPDNEVTRPLDEKRIQWMADDLIKNRPALSRWHPGHADAFAQFVKGS